MIYLLSKLLPLALLTLCFSLILLLVGLIRQRGEPIARYPEHPLRTLDALHLMVAADLGVSVLATADGVMSDAAESIDFQVARF